MRRWEGNVKIDLKGVDASTRNWIDSAHDRDYWRAIVNAKLNLVVPLAIELVRQLVAEDMNGWALSKKLTARVSKIVLNANLDGKR